MKKLKNLIIIITIIFGTILFADLNLSWEHFYGGENNDVPEFLLLTDDGRYLTCGYTESYGTGIWGKPDAWLVKFDDTGNKLWDYTYGVADSIDKFYSMVEIDDGYLLAGQRALDIITLDGSGGMITKVDFDGNEVWSKKYGSDGIDMFRHIYPTNDGNFIVAGVTRSYGAEFINSWIVKMDVDGNEIWNHHYGGSGYDILKQIYPSDDGGYIGAGYTTSYGEGSYDIWVVKLDADGTLLWEKTHGNDLSNRANFVAPISNGNYILTGRTVLDGETLNSLFLMEVDNAGDILWEQTYIHTISDTVAGEGYCVEELPYNQGFLIGGSENNVLSGPWQSDGWIIKTDNQGNFSSDYFIHSPSSEGFSSIRTVSDTKYVAIGGNMSHGSGMNDHWIIELEDDDVDINDNYELSIMNYELKQNHPNPFNPVTQINYELRITNYEFAEIVVHNSVGQKVWSSGNLPFTIHHSPLYFDGSKLNSGIYYYSLVVDGKKMDTKSMILIK